MSLAKLTSISTQTLSLLLERQRLHTLPSFSDPYASKPSSLHLPQITRNLTRLRTGILDMEAKDGRSEAVVLLRSQYERMRSMLGDESTVERYCGVSLYLPNTKQISSLSLEVDKAEDVPSSSSPSPPASLAPTPPPKLPTKDTEPLYSPYTDDPEAGHQEPGIMLQTQRRMMDGSSAHSHLTLPSDRILLEQDQQLDRLSHSIGRQHHISVQINDELDVHTGLLEELDTDLDRTESRLTGARRRLDKVARGAARNCQPLSSLFSCQPNSRITVQVPLSRSAFSFYSSSYSSLSSRHRDPAPASIFFAYISAYLFFHAFWESIFTCNYTRRSSGQDIHVDGDI